MVEPDGFEPVLDSSGNVHLPASWTDQLVMFWQKGRGTFAMRFSDRPRNLSLKGLFYRASLMERILPPDLDLPRSMVEPIGHVRESHGNFLFDDRQRLDDDALPVPDWIARTRRREIEPAD